MRPTTNILVLASAALVSASCDSVEPVAEEPQQFVAVRRAWGPGERTATISQIETTGALGFFSPYASLIYSDPDSVTVVQVNPAWSQPAARVTGGPVFNLFAFSTGWNMAGIRLESYNSSQTPPDTVVWTGVFYYDPANTDNRGFIIRGGTTLTFGPVNVNTAAFEASGSRTGAGGGEVALGTGTEWTAGGPTIPNRNTLEVQAQNYGAASTITTGPWLGGTIAVGAMQGRLKRVVFNRIAGTSGSASFEVDVDFRGGIQALRIICRFPSPCTTNVPLLRDRP